MFGKGTPIFIFIFIVFWKDDWTNPPFLHTKQTNHFYCQAEAARCLRVDTRHASPWLATLHNRNLCLSQTEVYCIFFLLGKGFSAVLCSSFNAKTPSNTATTEAFTQVSFAPAMLAVTFSLSLCFSMAFRESMQRSPSVFVTAERTLVGFTKLRLSENTVDWSLQGGCAKFQTRNLSDPAARQN